MPAHLFNIILWQAEVHRLLVLHSRKRICRQMWTSTGHVGVVILTNSLWLWIAWVICKSWWQTSCRVVEHAICNSCQHTFINAVGVQAPKSFKLAQIKVARWLWWQRAAYLLMTQNSTGPDTANASGHMNARMRLSRSHPSHARLWTLPKKYEPHHMLWQLDLQLDTNQNVQAGLLCRYLQPTLFPFWQHPCTCWHHEWSKPILQRQGSCSECKDRPVNDKQDTLHHFVSKHRMSCNAYLRLVLLAAKTNFRQEDKA